MKKSNRKILLISGGVFTTGAIAILLVRKRNKKKQQGLLPPRGSDRSPANLLTTNSNALPSNFQNWNGGSDYLSNAPRGIRNNNPGNLIYTSIKWNGKLPKHQNKDRRFEMFIAPVYGVRAMIKDIKNDMERKGKVTVAALIEEYAPRSENKTEAYIQAVCKELGVSKTTKLLPTKNTLRRLVLSISRIETGADYVSPQLFERAYAMI